MYSNLPLHIPSHSHLRFFTETIIMVDAEGKVRISPSQHVLYYRSPVLLLSLKYFPCSATYCGFVSDLDTTKTNWRIHNTIKTYPFNNEQTASLWKPWKPTPSFTKTLPPSNGNISLNIRIVPAPRFGKFCEIY